MGKAKQGHQDSEMHKNSLGIWDSDRPSRLSMMLDLHENYTFPFVLFLNMFTRHLHKSCSKILLKKVPHEQPKNRVNLIRRSSYYFSLRLEDAEEMPSIVFQKAFLWFFQKPFVLVFIPTYTGLVWCGPQQCTCSVFKTNIRTQINSMQ